MALAEGIAEVPRGGLAAFPARSWRFVRRWPIIPGFILTLLIFSAIFAPLIAPHEPLKQHLRAANAPGFWDGGWYEEHPKVTVRYFLGGDHVGRDVLSRIIHGARISLTVVAVSAGSALIIGTALGLIAGYRSGLVDEVIMRFVDIWYALPFLLVALVVVIVLGQTFAVVMGVLAMTAWPGFVRNVRAEVLSLRERDYVALARIAGASPTRIIFRHILPGVINTIIVIGTLSVGSLILTEAALSFLGAGIPSPTPAWGLMVAEAREDLATAWWTSLFPGLAIVLVVMSLNFLGDWLRDRLDPRLRQLG